MSPVLVVPRSQLPQLRQRSRERCLEYLFNRNKAAVTTYRWLYIICVFIGPYMTVAAVWNIADIFNALMAFPNLIALLALSGVVVKETKDFFKRHKNYEF